MNSKQQLIKKLELPPMSQIGIVVKDMDKTIEYYEKVLGLGPFVRPDITYKEKHYYGEQVHSEWLMGFCSLGSVELEMIQPITGPTIYHDFLKEKGEGLHHLGFDVKDIERKLILCEEMGIKIIQGGQGATSRFEYLDTEGIGGVIFELIQREKSRV
jgi:catechol 2,3-dioxygenase-like lactoylglutathione lyase family enzyme